MSLVFLCAKGHHRTLPSGAPIAAMDRRCPVCDAAGAWLEVPAGYEVMEVLGHGGMGVVYKARELETDRVVALKMTHPRGHAGEDRLRRFQKEVDAITRLSHPGIVRIYRVGTQGDDHPYFSCEYVDGGSLDRQAARDPLSWRETALLAERVARAVHYAHQRGIVHRDLKPANILLTKDGWPKIADFGLVKFVEREDDLTRTGTIVGTPSFMSPEQAKADNSQVGPRSDVYSLGVMLYLLLSGQLPFRGPSCVQMIHQVVYESPPAPSTLRPGMPPELEAIALCCLQKVPQLRYRTAEALADDIARYMEGTPITFTAGSLPPRAMQWKASTSGADTVFLGGRVPAEADPTSLHAGGAGAASRPDLAPEEAPLPSARPEPKRASESGLFDEPGEDRPAPRAPAWTLPAETDSPRSERFRSPLFAGIEEKRLEALARSASFRRYSPGEVLFEELDPARSLFIITEGSVEIFRTDASGAEVRLASLGPDDVLGELGLILPGGVRTASARAVTPAAVMEIPGNIFELLRHFAETDLALNLMRNLMFILRNKIARRNTMRGESAAERLPALNQPSPLRSADDIKVLRESFSRELARTHRQTRRVKSGTWLIRQNDESDGFYFVHDGMMEVVDETVPSRPRTLAILTPPNIVGEVGFFTGGRRLAGVRVTDEATITAFTAADFDRLRKKEPGQALDLLFTAVRLAALLIVEKDWI